MRTDDIKKSRTLREWQKLAQAYPPLTESEERILAYKAAKGDEVAQEKLFKHNSARILYFALAEGKPEDRKQSHKPHGAPWPTHDEVASYAAEGLWWAVTHYQPGRIPFNQWANLCIRTFIRRQKAAQDRREIRYLIAAGDYIDHNHTPDRGFDPDRVAAEIQFLSLVEKHCSPEVRQAVQSFLDGDPPMHRREIREKLMKELEGVLGEEGLEKLKRTLLD